MRRVTCRLNIGYLSFTYSYLIHDFEASGVPAVDVEQLAATEALSANVNHFHSLERAERYAHVPHVGQAFV